MRRSSAILLAIGLVLGAIALVGLLNLARSSGDATVIEERLVPSVVVPEITTPTPTSTPEEPSRWTSNPRSRLDELSEVPRITPTRLVIDSIGVDAPIVALGVDSGGQMDVPPNATDVAWYEFGPAPGEPGSAVLAAHVDLASAGPGVFFDLREVGPGDLISVEMSDGEERRFEVVARVIYRKEELPVETIFARHGGPVLTLVTCGGGFSRDTGRYDSNVVVYATQPDAAGQQMFG